MYLGRRLFAQVNRATLADANEGRDWRIWRNLAALLIRCARKLYCNDSVGIGLDNTVHALEEPYFYSDTIVQH